ncbi:MAG: hypothetical protein F4114_16370 [Rhodospirillaceae bacterium]|nr:hypothetical protein [Rhodospirillaceae bacterium]MYB12048.1 hypothetical protein [Rhodospirillaceae bacterium]MYI50646.1 hypothetical protein [Rhodospirillaceae bacterium]
MSAAMVRTGGILVFFLILAVLVSGIMLAGAAVGAGGRPDPAGFGAMLVLMTAVYNGVMTFVYWTTKGLFNAFSYSRADFPILTLMTALALNLLLTLLGGGNLPATGAAPAGGGGLGVLDALSFGVLLAMIAAWIWFSVAAIGFGAQVGSLLWRAIGIVYLVASGLVAIALALLVSGSGAAFGMLALLAGAVMLGGWICHGIGLIVGAKEMARI